MHPLFTAHIEPIWRTVILIAAALAASATAGYLLGHFLRRLP